MLEYFIGQSGKGKEKIFLILDLPCLINIYLVICRVCECVVSYRHC